MEQRYVERLLLEAKEGERLIKPLEPDFLLEELILHTFKAWGDAGKNIGFSVNAQLTQYDESKILSNIGKGERVIQDFKNAFDAYFGVCRLASRQLKTGNGDLEDYKLFEKSIKDLQLYYGRIMDWKSEVDINKVYKRIKDMRTAADYYVRNGSPGQKKDARKALEFFDNILEENKYVESLSPEERIYKGPLGIEAIARDSFAGEVPRKEVKFARKKAEETVSKPVPQIAPEPTPTYSAKPSISQQILLDHAEMLRRDSANAKRYEVPAYGQNYSKSQQILLDHARSLEFKQFNLGYVIKKIKEIF